MSTQYNEGTATFTSGSQTVTGQGTTWTPAMVGKRITRAGSGIPYIIGEVNSFTSITLTSNYAGATESAVPYAIQIGETTNYGFPEYDFQGVDPATFLNEFSWAVDGLLAPATPTTLGTVKVTSSATDTTNDRTVLTQHLYASNSKNYHDGNLNVNVFGGLATNKAIASGYVDSSSTVSFYLPVGGLTNPLSVTVSGTFSVMLATSPFTTIATGVNSFSMTGDSSERLVKIFNSSLSGLTPKEPIRLVTESTTSKITVNF